MFEMRACIETISWCLLIRQDVTEETFIGNMAMAAWQESEKPTTPCEGRANFSNCCYI